MQPVERQTTGYLSQILTSGARPLQFRITARSLLTGAGLAGQVDHSRAPPPVGFTYAHRFASVDLIASLDQASFDGAVPMLAAEIAPVVTAVHALGRSDLARPNFESGAGPHVASDPARPRRAQFPFTSRLPVEGDRPATSPPTPTLKANEPVTSFAGRPQPTVLKVPEIGRTANVAIHIVAADSRGLGEDVQMRRPSNHLGEAEVGRSIGPASDAVLAPDTSRGQKRALEGGAPPPRALLPPQARVHKNAPPEAIDLVPGQLPLKQPEPGSVGPTVGAHGIEVRERVTVAGARAAATNSDWMVATRPEGPQDARALETIEQLRSSVHALMTKAVAARAAPAEATRSTPESPAARPPRRVIVVKQSVERQRRSAAFWERRYLAWPQLKVLR